MKSIVAVIAMCTVLVGFTGCNGNTNLTPATCSQRVAAGVQVATQTASTAEALLNANQISAATGRTALASVDGAKASLTLADQLCAKDPNQANTQVELTQALLRGIATTLAGLQTGAK